MRLLSLNAWGGRLYPELMPYLAGADPDVLCLQEVVRSHGRQADWLIYRDQGVELPQRGNLFDELKALFPDHDAYFSSSMRGQLMDGDTPVWTEFGLATLVRRSLSVIGQSMDFVHGDFSPEGWGEHPRGRSAHVLRLFNTVTGSPVTVAHLHGLRELAGKHDTPARQAQAEALLRLIRQVWRPEEQLIACGDFNVLPESVTFEILGRAGLADLVTGRGFTDTRTSYYAKDGRYADYLLVTPNVEIIDFQVVATPEVSDHRPLLLDFR